MAYYSLQAAYTPSAGRRCWNIPSTASRRSRR